jgi:hypothetical protein
MQQNTFKAQLINRSLQISRLKNLMACCKDVCQRYGMDCCTMDECIAPCGVHYIGGRDPPRAGGQGGGNQGRRL